MAATAGIEPARIVAHEPAPPGEMVREAAAYDVGLALEPPVSVNNDLLLSNKIFTYLLAGAAVIATRTTGQAWLAASAGSAVQYCEPGRPESLAAALRPWLEDRGKLEAARWCAWSLGATRFNWDCEKTLFLDAVVRTVGVRCRES
jgi:hypothetical protein